MSSSLPNPERVAAAWSNQDAFALSLLVLFLDQYGPEGTNWSPVTIGMEIRDDTGVDLSPALFDHLMTAIDILTSNAFFLSPADFTRGCAVLAGHAPLDGGLILPGCAEVAWGITEALLIHPPTPGQEEQTFSAEVRGYIGTCLDDEGFLQAPDVLRLGLRSPGHTDRAHTHAADTLRDAQDQDRQRGAALTAYIREHLLALFHQLRSLPLVHGETVSVVDRLLEQFENSPY